MSEQRAIAGDARVALLALYDCDDLPVRDVAAALERTEHATEALLVRARAAFRRAYTERGEADPLGKDAP